MPFVEAGVGGDDDEEGVTWGCCNRKWMRKEGRWGTDGAGGEVALVVGGEVGGCGWDDEDDVDVVLMVGSRTAASA